MTPKARPALVGAFVVGAFALIGVALVIWGSRALFERRHEYVCYFPGSVEGLGKGSPVKYRGVQVGVVKDIKIRFRQAPDDNRIPVLIELWGKRLHELGGDEPTELVVKELVANGLRARIASASFVTGVAYVNLSEQPATKPQFSELPGPGAVPEIPTLSTELDETTKAVSELLAELSTADFKGMIDSISQAMNSVNQVATSEDLQAALARLPRVLSALRRLSDTLNTGAGKAGETVEELNGALSSLHDTLESTRGVISPQAPLSVELSATLSDVDEAAVAVRQLADFLRRNPHAVVAGTKPRGGHP